VHMHITTIGLDIAKNVFQVHGIDATEKVILRKQLRRGSRNRLESLAQKAQELLSARLSCLASLVPRGSSWLGRCARSVVITRTRIGSQHRKPGRSQKHRPRSARHGPSVLEGSAKNVAGVPPREEQPTSNVANAMRVAVRPI